MKAFTLPPRDIGQLLERHRRLETIPDLVPVHELFSEILQIADQFVPSEAGSLLLDDPAVKVQSADNSASNELVFVACYGEKAEQLLGQRIPAAQGIVGRTYLSGEAYFSSDVSNDRHFSNSIDEATSYTTRSVICVPIKIELSTCGVLELINRRGSAQYRQSELDLLQIFAGYISTSLQNALDASRYRELAKRDDLSGLYNDRHFNFKLSEEIQRAEAQGLDLSLIFLDLDYFKSVNDRFGHLVGSQTLREVGLLLSSVVPAERGIAARYGGDEFVIIVFDTGLQAAQRLAEEILAQIRSTSLVREPEIGDGRTVRENVRITASLGVASYRHCRFKSTDSEVRKYELIRMADQAMYDAKESGRNRICFRAAASDTVGPALERRGAPHSHSI
jgi:diguanylate cyclase (GGDEF)-like protein